MRLPPEQLFQPCPPSRFPFETTAGLPNNHTQTLGQDRAFEAMRLAVGVPHQGFNLYLLAPPGFGLHAIATHFLQSRAAADPTPPEWSYINNFANPEKPRALSLPAGRAASLRDDLRRLVDDLRVAIPSAFESENYRARKHEIEQETKDLQDEAMDTLHDEAAEKGFALLRSPTGILIAPARNGEILTPKEFEEIPEEEHKKIEEAGIELQEKLRATMLALPRRDQEGREKLRQLNDEVAAFAVGHLIDALRLKYLDLPAVTSLLDEIRQAVIDNVDDFLSPPENPLAALMTANRGPTPFRQYQLNLLVEHTPNAGAPVVYEDHPTYPNLIGQVEYLSHMGALSTDFTLIRPGALHRANGGYLVLDALKLLTQPYAWDALKRSLKSNQIRIESLGEMLGLLSTVSLKPETIPLKTKVILIGDRYLYYLLASLDPDFSELFKIAADFEEHTPRTPAAELDFAHWLAALASHDNLLPLHRDAVARVVEHASRAAEDSTKLLTIRRVLSDLLTEADFLARQADHPAILAADVQSALDAQRRRASRTRERLLESTLAGTLMIDTEGERIGQINGLTVLSLADFSFGHPARITARVRMGEGELVDIEREVELGGPIHSKGVFILAGFLSGRYAIGRPLSLTAFLAFEQSYAGVEGDSASAAELFALLSALAAVPIQQSFAVTGSVNQLGEIQAIGGVNEKIEGFFDLCAARGGPRGQSVLIPAANVRHLMLRADVVDAVRAGNFHIHAIATVDEGLALLSGLTPGERNPEGNFPVGSLNYLIEARLLAFAEKRQAKNANGGVL